MKYGDMQETYIKTDYGNVHYLLHKGSADSILLIHGLAGSSKSWSRFVDYLPENYTLCIVDLLGHGKSDAPHISYNIGVQVKIIEAIMRTEGLAGAFIMGHSYGGWIAAKIAISDKVSGLILEDAGGLKNFFDEVRGTEKREAYKKEIISKALSLNAKEYVISSIFDDEFSNSELSADELNSISVPTLILWGSDDRVISARFAEIFHKEIPGSVLRIINRSKHTSHYTNPEEVAGLVVDFINGRLV
ncbi:MAG: alpha/beta hydrolase [Candidatus Marsarchaeota archaeon]|jgi:pimeloyl-ACP methyl ester carboxylesterase|nr:alpha/beta hydrolase [Candidatus Marsarchaeota archaeon]